MKDNLPQKYQNQSLAQAETHLDILEDLLAEREERLAEEKKRNLPQKYQAQALTHTNSGITLDWWSSLTEKAKKILYAQMAIIKEGYTSTSVETAFIIKNPIFFYEIIFKTPVITPKSINESFLQEVEQISWLIYRELDLVNEGIIFLQYLKNLQKLDLFRNQIQDISPLKDLKSLRELYLWNNQIQDISPLKDLKSLRELYLWNNQIQDISPLKDLKNLRELYLLRNQIQDISPLKGLKNLQTLYLEDNQIQDISPLKGLKNLQTLYLEDNPISKKDIEDLQKVLPNCRVIH